jgi:hypothetical protein
MPELDVRVTLGADTHADVHVATALDQLGRLLGTISIPTTTAGFPWLLEWATGFGVIDRAGVEGTGRWGAGLWPAGYEPTMSTWLKSTGPTGAPATACGCATSWRWRRGCDRAMSALRGRPVTRGGRILPSRAVRAAHSDHARKEQAPAPARAGAPTPGHTGAYRVVVNV